MEVSAVRQNYARAGDYNVGDEEGWISPVVIRDPAVDEAACVQSAHARGSIVAIVGNIGAHHLGQKKCESVVHAYLPSLGIALTVNATIFPWNIIPCLWLRPQRRLIA